MQQLLQRADVVAHRGLGKVELFRGGGEAAGVHDGGKDLKLTEIQTFHRTASFCGFLNVIVESVARFVKCFHGKFGVFHRKKTMKNAGRPEKAVFKPCAVCYDGRETTDGRSAHDLS